jgi:hypothetical protein
MLFDGLPEGTFRLVDGQVEVPAAAGIGLGVGVETLLAGR